MLNDENSTGSGLSWRARSGLLPQLDVQIVSSMYESTGSSSGMQVRERDKPLSPSMPKEELAPRPAKRDALRRRMKHAERVASRLVEFQRANDLMALSNAGFELERTLDDLWALRSECDEDWADLLNVLQGSLKKLEFEKMSQEQCAAVQAIVSGPLGDRSVDDTGLEDAVLLLRKVGLDPWKAISGSIE